VRDEVKTAPEHAAPLELPPPEVPPVLLPPLLVEPPPVEPLPLVDECEPLKVVELWRLLPGGAPTPGPVDWAQAANPSHRTDAFNARTTQLFHRGERTVKGRRLRGRSSTSAP
jgi:hypothetical protein